MTSSDDLIKLLNKIYREGYSIISINSFYESNGGSPTFQKTVTLKKSEETISITSYSYDFFIYCVQFRTLCDPKGNSKLGKVNNVEEYDFELMHLIDTDNAKLDKAKLALKKGEFKFKYDPNVLLNELFDDDLIKLGAKFLPLRNDYYYILALLFSEASGVIELKRVLSNTHATMKAIIDYYDKLTIGFNRKANPIVNLQYFRACAGFNIAAHFEKFKIQIDVIDDVFKELTSRKQININIAAAKILDVYGRCIELVLPIINLFRIALELSRGIKKPIDRLELAENMKILNSEPTLQSLLVCINPTLRHCDVHISWRIENHKIALLDTKGRKTKTIASFSLEEIHEMSRSLFHLVLPALLYSISIHDTSDLLLVLLSKEYKALLLGISNS